MNESDFTGMEQTTISRRTALAALGVLGATATLGGGAAFIHAAVPRITETSWTSFRNGPSQRGLATSTLPKELKLLWSVEAGPKDGMVTATAAIVGEHVYVASLNGEVFALDRLTGRRLWTYRSRENVDPNQFVPGFKASVAVHEGHIFIGDEEGLFHAIDRETGAKVWTFSTNPDDPSGGGSPIVSCASFFDDKVIFGSHDNHLYCLRTGDGSLAWKFATLGMVNCSPAISERHTFVTGCDSHLRVIDIGTGQQVTDVDLGIYLIASPAVVDNMLYVGTHGGEVLAIDWKLGKNVWTYTPKQQEVIFHSSAAVSDRYVIVGGQDKKLHCLNRQTGEMVWIFNAKRQIDSSPVIVGDRVFVGSHDGRIYGIDLATGKEVWSHVDGRPFSASPAVGEGCLVIGSEASTGKIYCFGEKN